MPTILITGAGRGLGLEFARQYAEEGWHVLACVRSAAAANDLVELAAVADTQVVLHELDVADHASIDRLARTLTGTAIDVLLNNAGTIGAQSFAERGIAIQRFAETDYADWEQMFRVNVLGPMKMAEAFVEHVAASAQKKIVTLTSVVGSIAGNTIGGLYAYRSTKAAANAVMRSMGIDLAKRGIIALPMHPGWARTAMGGPRAELDPADAVRGVREVIANLTPEQAGRFMSHAGTELPW
ncbi:MAG TPA: SDR family oxidoreductase [Steroidobacteraceae bacterium]|nr:SDR family oxidoreductase [Steroidobacteraceae bacterium]